jgi:PKD repeat protein
MPAGRVIAAIAIVAITALAGLSHASDSFPAVTRSSSGVSASADFGGWSWYGTGAPCVRGSNLTFVAHFFGNATGGVPPYAFAWSFGDGSNTSVGQNVTHVFLTHRDGWEVGLNVTDYASQVAGVLLSVFPPIFNCPAQQIQLQQNATSSPMPTYGLIVLGVGLAAYCVVMIVWAQKQRRA